MAENLELFQKSDHSVESARKDVVKYFNEWAQEGTYEKNLNVAKYKGPTLCADAFQRHLTDTSVRILDVGAGTGLVGAELRKRGFRNIDGLDPAASMLAVAKERVIYQNYYTESISAVPTTIGDDTYDALGSTGSVHYMPCVGLDELWRIVKPGGVVILAIEEKYLVEDRDGGSLEWKMKAMEEAGRWKVVERRLSPNHFFDDDAVLFVFHVIKSVVA